jgi:hypothetical protein
MEILKILLLILSKINIFLKIIFFVSNHYYIFQIHLNAIEFDCKKYIYES